MKKTLLLLCLIILITSFVYCKKEFTIIGKWKAIESIGSNGATKIHSKIENGDEIIFEEDNIVIDHRQNKGKYEMLGDSLHIVFPNEEFFYFCRSNKWNSEEISLTPLTKEYQLICDEGCSTIYKKL
ncbi:hypothetical protein [Flavobacterium hercynium]|uniref:Lipocalin-like domain-containing protein n=1 Tax=Flavobacterium hercynium TaxID=387094 RepID=A0A226HL88_9FLAO|nr:hypothetical protein [Flavobacterium hercynium]OXA94955.1 hypothetical protein B0A66_04340 [Flavobacterium hercynium]SMP09592.1 hypothetical protein SAMN06265346_102296 [Flavobacterium hercynium]